MYVRKPAVAGSFYPEEKEDLVELIEACFLHDEFGPGELPKKKELKKEIVGAIVPHAGYIFSGPCAAWVYLELFKNIPEDSEVTFIILGPNHTGVGADIAIISEGKFETPLGEVEIDSEVAKKLKEIYPMIEDDVSAHEEEHSIEVQLPFLQYCFNGKFKIVPIVLRGLTYSEEKYLELGYSLRDLINYFKDKRIIVLASSDFTHYGPGYGFFQYRLTSKEDAKEYVRKLDEEAIKLITSLKLREFLEFVDEKNPTICGYAGIATLIALFKSGNNHENSNNIKGKLLQYYTSDDIKPYPGLNFVSYAAIIFYKKKKKNNE